MKELLEILIIIIFYIFVAASFLQVLYYLVYLRFVIYKESGANSETLPVSVVICAKNEEDNLRQFLSTVMEQNYQDFEVIVVNDSSTDGTADVLRAFQNKYPNLYVTHLDRKADYIHGKKLSITIALKAAKNDIILFTDADCIIDSEFWIENMQKKFDLQTKIVLGYGGYLKDKGLLNRLIRYDTLFIAIQYFAYTLWGLPYMGVGRNMAYRKSLFFETKGFASHLKIASGDDDLFVNRNATPKNTKIIINKNAFTHSLPEKKFLKWWRQKRRHFTSSKYYKFKHKLMLGVEFASRIIFFSTFIFLMIFDDFKILIASIFGVRLILQILVLKFAASKLQETGVVILGVFFDFILPILNIFMVLHNFVTRNKTIWK